jgi:hypothetical protein
MNINKNLAVFATDGNGSHASKASRTSLFTCFYIAKLAIKIATNNFVINKKLNDNLNKFIKLDDCTKKF